MASNAPTAYTKPKVFEKGNGNVKLLEARHPCLEVQDDIIFMANDIEMEKGTCSFFESSGVLLNSSPCVGISEFQIISKI